MISNRINELTGRGATLFNATGSYEQKDIKVLYVVISQSQVTKVKKIVLSEDKNAFLAIHDVRDVLGREFMNLS